jgi:hypothetical protein
LSSAVAANAQSDNQHEPRPWEAPGAVRKDYEPHRARLLLALGGTALACGALAVCLTAAAALCVYFGSESALFYPCGTAPGLWFLAGLAWWSALVGTVAGVPACLMARHDAGPMRAGRMDPAGLPRAGRAASWGRVGAALGVAVLGLWPAAILCFEALL